jgi:hypothetical protein
MHASPDRHSARMEKVLEETCQRLRHGGDHELRSFVAERMLEATSAHQIAYGHLGIIARKALADYQAGL